MISFISMTRKNKESPMGWAIGEMRLAARVDLQVGTASNSVIFKARSIAHGLVLGGPDGSGWTGRLDKPNN